jgi:hypothetical protein
MLTLLPDSIAAGAWSRKIHALLTDHQKELEKAMQAEAGPAAAVPESTPDPSQTREHL